MKEFKNFFDTVRENLNNFRGKYDHFIDYGPDLLKLLVNLLDEKEVGIEERRLINAALAYFIAPKDVIPEEIYGPFGYVDDIFICAYVLKELEKKLGVEMLEQHWGGDDELKIALEDCFNKSRDIIKEKSEEILEYAGLK